MNIQALLSLLEDPDQSVFEAVSKELLNAETSVLPDLEIALSNNNENHLNDRLEKIIFHLRFRRLKEDLTQWVKSENKDLLEGWVLISRYNFPNIDTDEIKEKIEKLVSDVSQELSDGLTPLEKTAVLNHVYFDIYRLGINTSNFMLPNNCFINELLTSKKGNPVSLAILYCYIAAKVKLPIVPLDFSKHLFLGYEDLERKPEVEDAEMFRFYINPVNRGSVIGYREMEYFMKKEDIKPSDRAIACKNIFIIERLLRNLSECYKSVGDTSKSEAIRGLINTVNCTNPTDESQ